MRPDTENASGMCPVLNLLQCPAHISSPLGFNVRLLYLQVLQHMTFLSRQHFIINKMKDAEVILLITKCWPDRLLWVAPLTSTAAAHNTRPLWTSTTTASSRHISDITSPEAALAWAVNVVKVLWSPLQLAYERNMI